MENNFKKLGITPQLVDGLKKAKIISPTPIQQSAIPFVLENKDLIAESATGSGKTLAYVLPIFQRIEHDSKFLQSIILAPTHELAHQINSEIQKLADNSGIPVRSAAITGDANIKRQIETLKKKPHIIVGSTGRILELIGKKKIKPHTVKTIVIDECDKLFHKSNLDSVKAVIKTTLRDRQLIAFSASVNEESLSITKEIMKSPEAIRIESQEDSAPIQHIYVKSTPKHKFKTLRKVINASKPKKAIIFLNQNNYIQDMTAQLQHHNFKAACIFGNASKNERRDAVKRLRLGKINFLVSSDLAARGLDISDVTHVFNLDISEDLKEYLHRAGRTGRAGKKGNVVSIVTDGEEKIIKRISKKFDLDIKEKDLFEGKYV